MAEKHVHKVYGSFPPWGKSVEFPATGGGGGNYVYFDIGGADLTMVLEIGFSFSTIIRLEKDGLTLYPFALFATDHIQKGAVLKACMIPTSLRYTQIHTNNGTITNVEWSTSDEVIKMLDEANIPRITEEEFYDTNWGTEG